MASIVQSTLHMSAKASVSKTESLKQQRSVKSAARTSVVTFASSEETSRRQAMSLFAVRFFFSLFLRGESAQIHHRGPPKKKKIRLENRIARVPNRPPRELSIDYIFRYSSGLGCSSRESIVSSDFFFRFRGSFRARSVFSFSIFFFVFSCRLESSEEISYPTFFFLGAMKNLTRNLFGILSHEHRAPPL